jgi:hypothetical protein
MIIFRSSDDEPVITDVVRAVITDDQRVRTNEIAGRDDLDRIAVSFEQNRSTAETVKRLDIRRIGYSNIRNAHWRQNRA